MIVIWALPTDFWPTACRRVRTVFRQAWVLADDGALRGVAAVNSRQLFGRHVQNSAVCPVSHAANLTVLDRLIHLEEAAGPSADNDEHLIQ